MQHQTQLVAQVNKIIQTNLDRRAGYEKARKEVRDPQLQNLFDECASQSNRYVSELEPVVTQFGGTPVTDTSTTSDMYRAWMDVKSALASNNAKAVLQSCEKGEDIALSAYREITNQQQETAFDPGIHQMLRQQHAGIESMHEKIKSLRDQQA